MSDAVKQKLPLLLPEHIRARELLAGSLSSHVSGDVAFDSQETSVVPVPRGPQAAAGGLCQEVALGTSLLATAGSQAGSLGAWGAVPGLGAVLGAQLRRCGVPGGAQARGRPWQEAVWPRRVRDSGDNAQEVTPTP